MYGTTTYNQVRSLLEDKHFNRISTKNAKNFTFFFISPKMCDVDTQVFKKYADCVNKFFVGYFTKQLSYRYANYTDNVIFLNTEK